MENNNVFKTGTVMDMVPNVNPDNLVDHNNYVNYGDTASIAEAAVQNKMIAMPHRTRTIVREYEKIGRNEPCPCGSGKKYKNCCLASGKYENLHELSALEMANVRNGDANIHEFTKTA